MRSTTVLSILEVSYAVMLMSFLIALPLVFSGMPQGVVEEGEPASTPTVVASGMEPKVLFEAEGEYCGTLNCDRPSAVFSVMEQTPKTEATDSGTGKDENCDLLDEEGHRWTVGPFLVALVGGGIFSLEAFEAIPFL
eukprot:TRINITY_DN115780_c0_g1_i1.p2 TRINITY_DN115780_c0_g1~~TRINITY_DN115780_c0_g1_i1.p2  ORF type:complete len:137 (+),score=30.68 TRINITY_DN115780_c0_g1_i1:150-560(+)